MKVFVAGIVTETNTFAPAAALRAGMVITIAVVAPAPACRTA